MKDFKGIPITDEQAVHILAFLANTRDCPVCAPAFADDDCVLCHGEGFIWMEPKARDDA